MTTAVIGTWTLGSVIARLLASGRQDPAALERRRLVGANAGCKDRSNCSQAESERRYARPSQLAGMAMRDSPGHEHRVQLKAGQHVGPSRVPQIAITRGGAPRPLSRLSKRLN